MKPEIIQNNTYNFLVELDSKDSAEARNNLLGFFEVLIEIDQQLKKDFLPDIKI